MRTDVPISAPKRLDHPVRGIEDLVRKRIDELSEWLSKNGQDCQERQSHLDSDSTEQVYWHYGYLMALHDIANLLARKKNGLN